MREDMTREQKIWLGGKTIWKAVKPLLAYLFLPGLTMLGGMLIRGYSSSSGSFSEESGNFYTCISIILLGYLLSRQAKKRGSSLFKEVTLSLENPDTMYCGLCVIFGASAGLFLSALITVFPFPAWMIQSYTETSSSIFKKNDLLLVILTVSILAPIMEEIIFRGYMLNRLLEFFTEKQAVWITALFFAFCHVNFLWVLYALGMGWILAWLAIKRDNILYSICMHVGFNLPSAVIAVINAVSGGAELFFGNRLLVVCYGVMAVLVLKLVINKMKGEKRG